MEGSRVDGAHARRRDRAGAAPPRPLQRLQRAGGDRRRRCSSGSTPERIAAALGEMRAAFGRVETIAVGGAAVSILLIKNPAGANEVLRTLLARRPTRRRAGIDLWIALNDRIADGRDVSWIWDADFELLGGAVRRVICAGTRAPEMALRLKYAGWPEESIEVEPEIEASLDAAVAAAAGPPLRPPHLHRAAGAAQAARRPRPGEGVLAVSTRPGGLDREARSGTTSSAAPTPPTCRSGRSSPSAAAARCSSSAAGTGRVALHLARRGHRVIGLDLDAELIAAQRERAAGLPVDAAARRRARLRAAPSRSALALAPMQLLQLLADRGRARRLPRRVAAQLRPGGRVAAAIVEGMPEPEDGAPLAARRARGRRLGLLEPAAGGRGRAASDILVRRLRQTVSPAGELTEEPDEVTICTFTADAARGRGAPRSAWSPIERLDDRRRPTTTSARPSSSSEKEA